MNIHMFMWRNMKIINPSPAEPGYVAFANSEDPDQLASEEAN